MRQICRLARRFPRLLAFSPVLALAAWLAELGRERPPLGEKPLLMDPPLPYVYGRQENEEVPEWLRRAVDAVRAGQPREWAPGETPWPKAPKGAHAST